MAEGSPLTPEKQLLNLIEKPVAGKNAKAAAIKKRGTNNFSIGAIKGRISFISETIRKGIKSGNLPWLDIRVFNVALEVVTAALIVFFVSGVMISMNSSKKLYTSGISVERQAQKKPKTVKTTMEDLSYYLEKIGSRDIFKIGSTEIPVVAKESPIVSEPASSEVVDATKHLRLVGISWSKNPDAMIEDTKALRTFFLKAGQMIGEVQIKEIHKDKVIIRYNDEDIELK